MSNTPDLSSLFEMLNNKNSDINFSTKNASNTDTKSKSATASLDDILNNISKDSNTSDDNNFQMPDMETMMKIMKLMKSMNSNQNNPSATLLYSLKPFLRDSKKEKVDQYIKFLKISSIISEINKSGGELN